MAAQAVTGRNSFVSEAITSYMAQVRHILEALPVETLERIICRLDEARWKGQQVFTCGNGGSAATAIHFASDLSKGALVPDKPPIRAESLCDNVALLTGWANDASFDEIFTRQMGPWIKAGDVLIAISASGNSRNVLNAAAKARDLGATTIGFTGFNGGRLKDNVDICAIVSCSCMEQIEDVHLLLCHLITTCLRNIPPQHT